MPVSTQLFQCHECGDQFTASPQGRPLYCGAACRQRAYRKRKKQDQIARSLTLDMDQRMYAMKVKDLHPEIVDRFNTYVDVHGVIAFSDMLDILKIITE